MRLFIVLSALACLAAASSTKGPKVTNLVSVILSIVIPIKTQTLSGLGEALTLLSGLAMFPKEIPGLEILVGTSAGSRLLLGNFRKLKALRWRTS